MYKLFKTKQYCVHTFKLKFQILNTNPSTPIYTLTNIKL